MRLLYLLLFLASESVASAIIFQTSEPVRITNSNQVLENSSFFLASHANCPVIIVGNEEGDAITNIVIRNVEVDGNLLNQDQELYTNTVYGVMNNNGIVIQNAKGVLIENVSTHDCRSGGLITTRCVSNLTISNLSTYHNFFDGLACYHTTDSKFINISSYSNCAAGLSFDLMFNRNTLTNISLSDNTVGIFMRDSNFNEFNKVAIINTTIAELFVAQVDNDTNKACSYNKFLNIVLQTNKVFTNQPSCIGNIYDITTHNYLPTKEVELDEEPDILQIKQNENNETKRVL